MAYYQLGDPVREIELQEIRPDAVTAAYVSGSELEEIYQFFGFDPETVEECREASPLYGGPDRVAER